jgi:hypothetical protein
MFEIQRLRWRRRRIIAKANKESAEASKANHHAEALQVAADCYSACKHIDDRVDWLLDQSIRQDAQDLDIAMPLVTQQENR